MTIRVWETLKEQRENLKAEHESADYWHGKLHKGHSRAECPDIDGPELKGRKEVVI